jgi:hypothetical protein
VSAVRFNALGSLTQTRAYQGGSNVLHAVIANLEATPLGDWVGGGSSGTAAPAAAPAARL